MGRISGVLRLKDCEWIAGCNLIRDEELDGSGAFFCSYCPSLTMAILSIHIQGGESKKRTVYLCETHYRSALERFPQIGELRAGHSKA